MKSTLYVFVGAALAFTFAAATPVMAASGCSGLPSNADLRTFLNNAANNTGVPSLLTGVGSPCNQGAISGEGCVGGLFGGARMWGAIVNRNGALCAYVTSTSDPTQVWPGSQAIAKAKAYTTNAFSLDVLALSTAKLYTFVQPGHSLFGLNNSNPFAPSALAPPSGSSGGNSQINGGIVTFGGGVPIYKSGKIVGGLGISGDTACADHEIAKRVRNLAGLDPSSGPTTDDIVFSSDNPPPPAPGGSAFDHPVCPNTYRNGSFIGNENPSSGY